MKCTDILSEEHRTILRALAILEQMAEWTEKNRHVEPEDIEALLHFLRAFADEHHQQKEESALFPELMRTSLANDGRLRQMKFEHDQERSLVGGLEDALRTKQGKDFVHFANWLVRLIRTHIEKEDNILFELAQWSLSPEQDERITGELNKFQVDSGIVAALERLERIYLRSAA
jgi:hemerythrin-like domain-containing protein